MSRKGKRRGNSFEQSAVLNYREAGTWFSRAKIIKKHVKKRGEIIVGAQSIKKQTGIYGRPTFDWDIISPKAKVSARLLEQKLDKHAGGNFYFTRPSKFHKGTHKVIHIGVDMRKNTRDDIPIVDISQPSRRLKTKLINGIKHSALSEEIKNKKKALADPQFAFRHQKDAEDIARIKASRRRGY